VRDLALLLRTCQPQWHAVAARRKQPSLPAGKRECTRCKAVKDEGEFYQTSRLRKDGTRPRKSVCKPCEVLRVVESRRG
jgi:hypothetical protein